jgi:predicted acylesterase/phospholipase RssA
MAAVLQRSAELASVAMQRQSLERGIDLYMRVPLRRFGMLDFDKASEIIAAGRELAREKLAGWQAVPGGGRPAARPEVR